MNRVSDHIGSYTRYTKSTRFVYCVPNSNLYNMLNKLSSNFLRCLHRSTYSSSVVPSKALTYSECWTIERANSAAYSPNVRLEGIFTNESPASSLATYISSASRED